MKIRVRNIHEKHKKRLIYGKFMRLLPALIAFSVRLLHRTCRFTLVGVENVRSMDAARGAAVVAFWHCCFPAVAYFFRDSGYFTIISESRDGELAAGMVESLGYRPFRGSPGKGGARAIARLIDVFRDSPAGGLVADGSQGPARIAQKGPVALALYSGVALYPVGMAAHPCWRLPSWDRTIVAKPFSHVVMAVGPPLRIEKGSAVKRLEDYRVELERSLNALCEMAERAAQGLVAENCKSGNIRSIKQFLLRMKNRYPEQGK